MPSCAANRRQARTDSTRPNRRWGECHGPLRWRIVRRLVGSVNTTRHPAALPRHRVRRNLNIHPPYARRQRYDATSASWPAPSAASDRRLLGGEYRFTRERFRAPVADPPGKRHLVAFENGQEAPAKQRKRAALTSLLHGVVDRFSRPTPPESEVSGPEKGR